MIILITHRLPLFSPRPRYQGPSRRRDRHRKSNSPPMEILNMMRYQAKSRGEVRDILAALSPRTAASARLSRDLRPQASLMHAAHASTAKGIFQSRLEGSNGGQCRPFLGGSHLAADTCPQALLMGLADQATGTLGHLVYQRYRRYLSKSPDVSAPDALSLGSGDRGCGFIETHTSRGS